MFHFPQRKPENAIIKMVKAEIKCCEFILRRQDLLSLLQSKSVDVEYLNTVISSTTCKLQPLAAVQIIMSSSARMMPPT